MSSNRYAPSIATIALTMTTLASTYLITKAISKYGVSGTLRLLWEGDHIPPHIRDAINSLDDLANRAIPKQARKLDKVDCIIQLAKLNSVDDENYDSDAYYDIDDESAITNNTIASASTSATANSSNISTSSSSNTTTSSRRRHYIIAQTPQLTKDLSGLSYNLDKLAAEVDAVQSHGDSEVKRRKKELSTLLVKMMERVDGFMVECGVTVSS